MFVSRTVRFIICALALASLATRDAAQTRPASSPAAQPSAASDGANRAKILRAAADALGMVRWSDIGGGATRLPGIDVINTMEFKATGMSDNSGQPAQTEYDVELAYNPPAMRVQTIQAGKPNIQTVRETYAWNESELGAGLVPGKGTATPQMSAAKQRILQLWVLPYGVVKAAIAAGDKTTVGMENGAAVLTFPLAAPLAGVTVKATLDANNFITKVQTTSGDPALTTESEYSDYADHGEIATDIKSPAHIVRTQTGRPVLDIRVKTWDANNPYVVFPIPPNVKTAAGVRVAANQSAASR